MTPAAFAGTELAPHGKLLHEHLGQHAALQAVQLPNGTDLCSLKALFVADDVRRDLQSAQAFASGFFPAACATEKAAAILLANGTYGLRSATSDFNHVDGCDTGGPTEEEAQELFGSTDALTARYGAQFRRVGEILGCCSASLCAKFGLETGGKNCSIDELPYTFNGVAWQGLYQGPLSASASFAAAWMLQTLSGVPHAAWNQLKGGASHSELRQLYDLQARLMWLGTNRNSSKAHGSHLLALLVASLEQLVQTSHAARNGAMPPTVEGAAPGSPNFLAIFAHDFNLLYLRRLLGASWLTESWDFDVAATGASVTFELHRTNHEDMRSTDDPTDQFTVVGVLTAASLEQQKQALPLVPPHAPPGRSIFLSMPYATFRDKALGAIAPECVATPLRQTVHKLIAKAAGGASAPSGLRSLLLSAEGMAVGVLFLFAGCAFGFLAGRAANTHERRAPQRRARTSALDPPAETSVMYEAPRAPLMKPSQADSLGASMGQDVVDRRSQGITGESSCAGPSGT